MGMMIGNEIIDPIERELANKIEGSANHYEAESPLLILGNILLRSMDLVVLVTRIHSLDKINSLSQ